MLPQFFKILVVNNSGQTITYNNNGRMNLKQTGVYVTPSTGKLAYTQRPDDDFAFEAGSSLAYGGTQVADVEFDNTGNLYINLQVQLEITHDEGASADGTFDMYLSRGDATGELEHNASGYDDPESNKLTFIGSLTIPSAAADDEVFRSPMFII